jgi:quercetin dioxygenase-like cupin family protein
VKGSIVGGVDANAAAGLIEVIDASARDDQGTIGGLATEDLNLTVLAWAAGHVVPGHVNAERDVAYVVVTGSAELIVDGTEHPLVAPAALVVLKGARRELRAGPTGVGYVTVHRARGGLRIAPRPTR